jgi:hypothetical protein
MSRRHRGCGGKQPAHVIFLDAMPMTPVGKPEKKALRDLAARIVEHRQEEWPIWRKRGDELADMGYTRHAARTRNPRGLPLTA